MKSRVDLQREHPRLFKWLYYNNRPLLDELFPPKFTVKDRKFKERLMSIALSGDSKPDSTTELGSAFYRLIDNDIDFVYFIQVNRPDWTLSSQKLNRFQNIINSKHRDVELLFDVFELDRSTNKYPFYHKKLGRFERSIDSIFDSWERGLSGHPSESYTKSKMNKISSKEYINRVKKYKKYSDIPRSLLSSLARRGLLVRAQKILPPNVAPPKLVLNIETRCVFDSQNRAAKWCNRGVTALKKAIRNGTKCGGYHWAYCDENGKVIKV